jgi:hypothetical protein
MVRWKWNVKLKVAFLKNYNVAKRKSLMGNDSSTHRRALFLTLGP